MVGVTPDGYLSIFNDPNAYFLSSKATDVDGYFYSVPDKTLALNVVFNSYAASPSDLTSLSSVFSIDET